MRIHLRRVLKHVAIFAGLAALAAFPFALACVVITDMLPPHDRFHRPDVGTIMEICMFPIVLGVCVGSAIYDGVRAWKNARADFALVKAPLWRACRRVTWRLASILAGLATCAAILVVSRLAFPMIIGAIEETGHGRFVAGAGHAIALVLWTAAGLFVCVILHMIADAARVKVLALRVVPLASVHHQPKESYRCPRSPATTP